MGEGSHKELLVSCISYNPYNYERKDIEPISDTFSIHSDLPSVREPFRLINRIPIRDCGEKLVDLRETNPDLLLSEKCVPFVRESVSKMLKVATALLPPDRKLSAGTALRTLKMQSDMYWGNFNRIKDEHPEWPLATVRRQTNRFWAPPDTKAPPGHCTGAAVDVKLCDENGEGLNCSLPLEHWKAAPTAAHGLDVESSKNRHLLAFVMHTAGFSNCRDEWWHWSYGDSAWAVRAGQPIAIYGFIEPPETWSPPIEAEK